MASSPHAGPPTLLRVFISFVLAAWLARAAMAGLIETGVKRDARHAVVIATVDDYRREEPVFRRGGDAGAATRSVELRFLKAYYAAGWKGDRGALLALYPPQMRATLSRQYKDSKQVREQFADLAESRVSLIVHYGDRRLVWVEHRFAGTDRAHEWVHPLRCDATRCLFVDDPEAVLIGSIVMRNVALHDLAPANAPRRDSIRLAAAEGTGNVDAVFIGPGEASSASVAAATERALSFMRLLQQGPAGLARSSEFFDAGIPSGISVTSSDAKGSPVSEYDSEAFARLVQRSPAWRPALRWAVSDDEVVVSLIGPAREVVSFRLVKAGSTWKSRTYPSRDSELWPLTQTSAYARAASQAANP